MPVLEALLADSASNHGGIKIYTSALSKVEVSFGATEQKQRALDAETEDRIDNLWADPGAAVLVEFHDAIGREAKLLTRSAITQGWSLKPLDAIHLATAKWLSDAAIPGGECFKGAGTGLRREYAALMAFKVLGPYTCPMPRMAVAFIVTVYGC